jgi:hypothetical protein
MIYVRVELWPFGLKEKARVIGEMTVVNIGGNEEWGNYEVETKADRGTGFKNWVLRHDRKESVWALLRKALEVKP